MVANMIKCYCMNEEEIKIAIVVYVKKKAKDDEAHMRTGYELNNIKTDDIKLVSAVDKNSATGINITALIEVNKEK